MYNMRCHLSQCILKHPGNSVQTFFCQQWITVLIRKREKSSFLMYHDQNYFTNQILRTEEIHCYDKVLYLKKMEGSKRRFPQEKDFNYKRYGYW